MNECTHCPVHCQSIIEILNERYRRYGKKLKRIYVNLEELKQANNHFKQVTARVLGIKSTNEEERVDKLLLSGKMKLTFKAVKLIVR